MQHKLFKGAAIGLAAVLAMTGCSSGETGGGGEITLNMVESLTSPGRTALLKTQLAEFEKANSGIKVNLISPPTNSADQKLQQMLQSEKGIDVLEVRNTTVGPFGANGWLYDMTSEIAGWSGWDDLTDAAKKGGVVNEKQYYIPYGFYVRTLFYRTDLVEQAGFEPPHSWADVLEQSEALTDPAKNQYGYAFRGGQRANGNIVAIIEAYVGDKVDPANAFKQKDGSTIFAAPEAKDAMEMYYELFKKGSPPSSVAWGFPEMVQGFSSGSVAFLLQTPEVIISVGESESITKEQWSTTPLPVGPTGKATISAGAVGWGVAESSPHHAEAVKLVQFLTEGAPALEFSKANSVVPSLKSAADDPFFKTGPWASYLTMNENPDTYLIVQDPQDAPWWTEWDNKADSEFQEFLIGQMSLDDLLSGWDKYWTDKWNNAG